MTAKPTDAQYRMLVSTRDHSQPGWHLSGRSAHGGGEQTRHALIRRGWIVWDRDLRVWRVTDSGAAAMLS